MEDLSRIGQRRKRLGMTQQQLAKEAGISQSLVAKIERGRVDPSYTIGCQLVEILYKREHEGERVASDAMHREVVSLRHSDSVAKAARLAREGRISQFPVMEKGVMVGSVSTENLAGAGADEGIARYISQPLPTVGPSTPLSTVAALLRSYKAVIVIEGGRMQGIITAEDLLPRA